MNIHFICPGSAKCGTTTLYEYLNLHPDLNLPPTKETNFFSHDQYYEKGKDWYEAEYFRDADSRLNGDISTGYATYHETAIPRILRSYGPDVKIILMIRDPVERAISHYRMIKYGGGKAEPQLKVLLESLERIHEASALMNVRDTMCGYSYVQEKLLPDWRYLQYIKNGFHGQTLNAYISAFGRRNVLLVNIEDLKLNPNDTLDQVQEFLGIRKVDLATTVLVANESMKVRFNTINKAIHLISKNTTLRCAIYKVFGFSNVNKFYYRIKNKNKKKYTPEKVEQGVRRRLKKIFLNDIELLERLTGKSFEHWK